jgi:hypothetical protein
MTRWIGVVLATGAAVVLLGGCGGGETPAQRGLPANTILVTQSNVLAYKPHTPQRTLMAWWRAMQYTDAPGYLSLLSEPVRKARRQDRAYRVQLPIIARYVDSAFPHIQKISVSGARATAYVEIEFRRLVGSDKYASTRIPQAFPMVRESGEWRMADDLFVEAGTDPEMRRRARELADAVPQPTRTVTVEQPSQAVPGLPDPGNGTAP